MSIEELVDLMTQDLPVERRPGPSAEANIAAADRRFSERYGFPLPEAYKRMLRHANGVLHNGLVIWPISDQEGFRQSIFEANDDLRETFDGRYVYLAQWDEELYVFDIAKKRYVALEFVGKPVWMEFGSDEQMFEFMLERAFR